MDERKAFILKVIVENYIEKGEPVSSRHLSKIIDLSAATLRNEMADLEEMGYLKQQHISSGRVPSDLGYRYYIENMMNRDISESNDYLEPIKELIYSKVKEVNGLMRELAELYTRLMSSTMFALPPDEEDVVLRGISNLLNFSEYNNLGKAKELMQFLDNRDNIRSAIVPQGQENQPIKIIIGEENAAEEMKDCTVVVGKFKTKNNQYGTIGIIGPTRMDYGKAVSTIEFLTKQLEDMQ